MSVLEYEKTELENNWWFEDTSLLEAPPKEFAEIFDHEGLPKFGYHPSSKAYVELVYGRLENLLLRAQGGVVRGRARYRGSEAHLSFELRNEAGRHLHLELVNEPSKMYWHGTIVDSDEEPGPPTEWEYQGKGLVEVVREFIKEGREAAS